jgi:RHS repeat-associated protein
MRLSSLMRLCVLLPVLMVGSLTSQGQTFQKYSSSFVGSAGDFATGTTRSVLDGDYNDPLVKPHQFVYESNNYITLRLAESSTLTLPDVFTVRVNFKVIYKADNSGDVYYDSTSTFLEINYNKNSTYQHLSSMRFPSVVSSTIRIESVVVTGSTLAYIQPALILDNDIAVTREYKFYCADGLIQALQVRDSLVATEGELYVSWPVQRMVSEYDLEWTYIDSSALARYYNPGTTTVNADWLFKNNSTRVSVQSTNYKIPLLYDYRGHLFIRVRRALLKGGDKRFQTAWSSDAPTTGLGRYDYDGHEKGLNWQSTISFAEDGKRKAVVQYFDGSLRSRQTVTKDNTTDTTIIAESFYDHQGRAVIQVLPSPSLSKLIGFTPNFNQSLNSPEYQKLSYDTLFSGNCLTPVPGMSATSGSSRYYSDQNPLKNYSRNQFIPDAKLYPFAETRYTADNTGRIAFQGGVGADLQIGKVSEGTSHETRYFYGGASQEELDALFGTEAGNASHYFKNMVRDPNGQYSVSYVDMHGRTVATALAGTPVAKLDALPSKNEKVLTRRLLDNRSNVVMGTAIQSEKALLVARAGQHRFKYSLLPESLTIADKDSINICYDCIYDLEITISDDCSNASFGGTPLKIMRTNLSVGSPLGIDCNPNGPFPGVDTSVYLPEGSYLVTKRLVINKQAMDYYRDSVYAIRNRTLTLEESIARQFELLRQTQECEASCSSCEANLGTWATFRQNYMIEQGISPIDSVGYRDQAYKTYEIRKLECDRLCERAGMHYDFREQMLADMSPPSGQYANADSINSYSIFYGNIPKWKDPRVNYLDENGRPEPVDPKTLSEAEFIARFKPSWAEALLMFHPEYPKLQLYSQLNDSQVWDDAFKKVTTFAEAQSLGYLNPGNFTAPNTTQPNIIVHNPAQADPFFTTYIPTLVSSAQKAAMQSALNQLSPDVAISMWSVATIAGNCGGNDSACISNYSSNARAFEANPNCVGNLDVAWKNFQSLYQSAKQDIINKMLEDYQQSTGGYSLKLVQGTNHYLRFPSKDYHLSALPVSTPNEAAARAAELATYTKNCEDYVAYWLEQLGPCNLSASEKVAISAELKQICIEGSDVNHPLGASSVKPSSTYPYRSFEQYLKQYLGSRYNENCNAVLIEAPSTYDKPLNFGDKIILAKPDSCECSGINRYYSEYQVNRVGVESFSNYLSRTIQLTVSQGTLDTLRLSCNGTLTCNFLANPVTMPSIFNCGMPPVCITCEQFDSVYTAFKEDFPGVTIIAESEDSLQLQRNKLYVNYMNQKLALNKDVFEYEEFRLGCLNGTPVDSVNAKAQALNDYKNSFVPGNAWSWVYGFPLPSMTQQTFIHDGIMQMPDSLADAYNSGCCGSPVYYPSGWFNFPQGYEMEVRLKARTNWPLVFIGAQSADTSSRAGFSLQIAPQSGAINIGLQNPDWLPATGPQIDPVGTPADWHTYRIRTSLTDTRVFIDGQLVRTFPRLSHQVNKPFGLVGGLYFSYGDLGASIDWIKVSDLKGDTAMFEDFLSPDSLTKVKKKFLYQDGNCETNFAAYYNTKFGTNYNFAQLDSLYWNDYKVELDVCATSGTRLELITLREAFRQTTDSSGVNYPSCQTAFTSFYNTRRQTTNTAQEVIDTYNANRVALNICGIDFTPQQLSSSLTEFTVNGGLPRLDAGGCDTTHWKVNYGNSVNYVSPLPLNQLMQNGVLSHPQLPNSSTWVDFDYYDTVCVNDQPLTFEYKIKSGTNPSFHSPDYFWLWLAWEDSNATPWRTLISSKYGTTPRMGYCDSSCADVPVPAIQSYSSPKVIRVSYLRDSVTVFFDGQVYFKQRVTRNRSKFRSFSFSTFSRDFELDYARIYDSTNTLVYNEEFNDCTAQARIALPKCTDCTVRFQDYFNEKYRTSYSYGQINSLYQRLTGNALTICGATVQGSSTLCGSPASAFSLVPFPGGATCKDSSLLAVGVGTVLYQYYRDSLIDNFNERYLAKCLAAKSLESFTVTDTSSEYHYTLYYYDQAGNLVKTVPPAGVDESKLGHMISWSDSIQLARTNKQLLTPKHLMETMYRYNTLNQVVAQQSPDGGKSQFWYDRLGRLAVSQNAKQYLASGTETNRLYSYTLYDFLGRITEVGQIKNITANPMTNGRSRDAAQLLTWITASATGKTEITSTYYDIKYAGLSNGGVINQTNLRNRVSYTSITSLSNPAQFNQATFYAYDIHGNVRQLTQDYGVASGNTANMMNARSNRYKSIYYDYDLISGKVNQVSYEPGFKDAWYHQYSYDAENRITKVETSVNGFHWETEARYEYYKHGPLARTILGNQQVQGVDYAYSLQGWLKGVNSTNLSADHDMGSDGATIAANNPNQYTAKDVYGFSLNYFAGDYQAISGQIKFSEPMAYLPAQQYRPLYNGNISSMAESIDKMSTSGLFGGKTMLYNYKYDQLNRITGMDAYNNYNVAGNNWSGMVKLDQYQERVSYDANGNIQKYLRNGHLTGANLRMDSLTYLYDTASKRNRLLRVTDSVPPTRYGTYRDLDSQAVNNYVYDAIGNIVEDKSENITSIVWSVYGKILEINRTSTASNPTTKIVYTYDAQGNRISSVTTKSTTTNRDYVWYIRDAQGNALGVYKATGGTNLSSLFPSLSERYIYGSNRLGSYNLSTSVRDGSEFMRNVYSYGYSRGLRNYELSNHLGNVLTTISDKKFGVPSAGNSSLIAYYTADVTNATSYYPFGSIMPGRTWSNGGKYRYGFNGQEKSDEIKGEGNSYSAEFWEYEPRLGRRWNLDPKPITGVSEYSAFGNNPIQFSDPLGDTLTNPQLASAAKIASKEIRDAIQNKRGFFVKGTNSRLLAAAQKYTEQNDMTVGDAGEFIGQVAAYHDGLASVAIMSSEDFVKLDRSVINNNKLTDFQRINITIGAINEADAELRSFLNISANVAIGEAAGSIGLAGGSARSARIKNISSRSFEGTVPTNINPGQQGKHIIGHNNYLSGRSILTANPRDLLKQFHANATTVLRQPNANRIIVEFHKPIGIYVNPTTKTSAITTRGTLNIGKSGVHIVPSAPR